MEKGEKLSLWPESPPLGPESDTILLWDASLCSDCDLRCSRDCGNKSESWSCVTLKGDLSFWSRM